MSDKFYALDRGQSGFTANDFTVGSASTPAKAVELRVADGASLTKEDVVLILKAFERAFLSGTILITSAQNL